jgi:hypothetical protein
VCKAEDDIEEFDDDEDDDDDESLPLFVFMSLLLKPASRFRASSN